MEDLNKKTQTPEETAQALSDLAEKLDEMDRAEGVYGETMLDKELEDVAGGVIPTRPGVCGVCGGFHSQNEPMHERCPNGYDSGLCPFVRKTPVPGPYFDPRP